jgi:hypothetical protein
MLKLFSLRVPQNARRPGRQGSPRTAGWWHPVTDLETSLASTNAGLTHYLPSPPVASSVLHWNETALDFYRSPRARPMDDWIGYRLDLDSLAALVDSTAGR